MGHVDDEPGDEHSDARERQHDQPRRKPTAHGVEVCRGGNGEVHALRGPGFAGVQFHPESVLSVGGAGVVGELLGGPAAAGTSPFARRRPAV